ncbi:MAG: hypothetical protein O7J95_07480, partial [Planctomycetota bacterium]|nr:hypothetical protein [Planctomycetota bacterium]
MKSSWCHARWCHAIRPGVVLALSILHGCSLHVESPHGSSLRPPGRLEEPDLATDSDGQLVGAWALVDDRGNADVVVSRFVAREGIWAPPRRANPSPGSAVAGRQVGPRIVVLPSGAVAVAWVDRGRDPAGDIVLATS